MLVNFSLFLHITGKIFNCLIIVIFDVSRYGQIACIYKLTLLELTLSSRNSKMADCKYRLDLMGQCRWPCPVRLTCESSGGQWFAAEMWKISFD